MRGGDKALSPIQGPTASPGDLQATGLSRLMSPEVPSSERRRRLPGATAGFNCAAPLVSCAG